jgi:hypothetical protein
MTTSSLQQPVAQSLEVGDTPGQHAPRALDSAHRPPQRRRSRLMVGDEIPLLITPMELRLSLGYGRTQFWRLEKAGAFDELLVKVGAGVRVYNGARIAELLRAGDGEDGRSDTGKRHYFGHAAARRHGADPTKRMSPAPRKSAPQITDDAPTTSALGETR